MCLVSLFPIPLYVSHLSTILISFIKSIIHRYCDSGSEHTVDQNITSFSMILAKTNFSLKYKEKMQVCVKTDLRIRLHPVYIFDNIFEFFRCFFNCYVTTNSLVVSIVYFLNLYIFTAQVYVVLPTKLIANMNLASIKIAYLLWTLLFVKFS